MPFLEDCSSPYLIPRLLAPHDRYSAFFLKSNNKWILKLTRQRTKIGVVPLKATPLDL